MEAAMRYLTLLLLFTTLTLFSMEEEEQRCPFPFGIPRPIVEVPERPQTPKEKKHAEQVETITERALTMYFETEDVDVHSLTFSADLFRTVNKRLRDHRKSVLKEIREREALDDLEAGAISKPNDQFRKEMRDLVTGALQEAFREKDEKIRIQAKEMNKQKSRVKIAAIGACTTLSTTLLGMTVALIVYFSE